MTKPWYLFIFLFFILLLVQCSPRKINLAQELEKNSDPTTFSLSNKRIEDDLAILGKYTNLEELILNLNGIESLPPEIGNLSRLKSLHIYGNSLQDLPQEFSRLQSLETLVLGRNPLTKVPAALQNLPKLRVLAMDGTKIQLTNADVEILSTLPSLAILDLSEMDTIKETPDNMEKLAHVKNILLKKTELNQAERKKMFDKLPDTRLVK